jgi:hypothetical protein
MRELDELQVSHSGRCGLPPRRADADQPGRPVAVSNLGSVVGGCAETGAQPGRAAVAQALAGDPIVAGQQSAAPSLSWPSSQPPTSSPRYRYGRQAAARGSSSMPGLCLRTGDAYGRNEGGHQASASSSFRPPHADVRSATEAVNEQSMARTGVVHQLRYRPALPRSHARGGHTGALLNATRSPASLCLETIFGPERVVERIGALLAPEPNRIARES